MVQQDIRWIQRFEYTHELAWKVMKEEGKGDNAKATIHFKNAGEKQLLLRFARFKVIE